MLRAMSRFIVVLLLAGACAGAQKPNQTAANGSGSGSNMVCHEVTDTGTLFSHTECIPAEDAQAQHDQAQDFMTRPRASPTNGK
jgi:hypothetical protein